MAVIKEEEFCAYHYDNKSDGNCIQCGLAVCNLDMHYNASAERICQICFNITRAKKIVRYIQIGSYVVTFGLFVLVWQLTGNLWYGLLPLVLVFLTPYLLRPVIIRLYFRELKPVEGLLPIVRYFEISGSDDYYKLLTRTLDKLTDDELENIKPRLYEYLVPALAFNFSKLPEEWEEDLVKKLRMTKEQFVGVLTQDYRKILIQTAVHNAQENMSKFLIYLGEISQDKDILKEYIYEITSPDVLSSTDEELNKIYNKLLEELYLYEEQFYEICDDLKLEKQKDLIKQLIDRYEPPPVPKNQIEAVMTIEQLREKRRLEKTGVSETTTEQQSILNEASEEESLDTEEEK
ncbi:MAG: hypothetical protein ACXABK_04805 [Candidatus Heimdallarchaeaceae archaeon]|jgi:hypothetical protein